MNQTLRSDQANIEQLLESAVLEAKSFLDKLPDAPAAVYPDARHLEGACHLALPDEGIGADEALTGFKARFAAGLSGSPGPRYLGFVTGGVTPAALLGDWLASVYDQNVAGDEDSSAPQVEQETIHLLRQLFGLPEQFAGTFVSGATISNFVGLAQARQWAGQEQGIDVAQQGLYKLRHVPVLSAAPHSSIYKSLAMLGMGRQVTLLPTLPRREALDVNILAEELEKLDGRPCIVVANAGTVNTVDFDDLRTIDRKSVV